jgi:hypothetical protein
MSASLLVEMELVNHVFKSWSKSIIYMEELSYLVDFHMIRYVMSYAVVISF